MSSSSPQQAVRPLPADGCILLNDVEVLRFIGTNPKCEAKNRSTGGDVSVGGQWVLPSGDTKVSVTIARSQATQSKSDFENGIGAEHYDGRLIPGIGEDAVLFNSPTAANWASLFILRGSDVIGIVVISGALKGEELDEALMATGRRLLDFYG